MTKFIIPAIAALLLYETASAQNLSYQLITSGLDAVSFESGLTELEAGDVNRDGQIDLVTIGDHGSPNVNASEAGIMLWKNNGDGTSWSLVKQGDFGYGGVALGDVNNDGLMDIGYAMHHNYSEDDFGNQLIETALGNGSGGSWVPYDDGLATAGETYGMFGIDFADVNNDGLLDLAANSFGCCNGFRVYQNNGNGTWTNTFTRNGGNSNQWCQFGDFNNDGNTDVMVALDGGQLWRNDGAGRFTSIQNGLVLGWNIRFDVADVNNDGARDIAVEKSGSAQVYFFDTTSSTWQSISAGLPTRAVQGVKLADMDMDGNADLVVWSARNISIHKPDPGFQWSQVASFTTSETALSGIAVTDFDHDGFNDIAYLASAGSGDNKLRVYLHIPDNPQLNLIPIFPRGGEHFIGGSIQFVQWLSSIPIGNSANVAIDFSSSGPGGPWTHVIRNARNSNLYQWTVPIVDSSNCFLRYRIRYSTAAKNVTTLLPFSISTLARSGGF
jgi:hypothetical protein